MNDKAVVRDVNRAVCIRAHIQATFIAASGAFARADVAKKLIAIVGVVVISAL